jgi:hypothetical protein
MDKVQKVLWRYRGYKELIGIYRVYIDCSGVKYKTEMGMPQKKGENDSMTDNNDEGKPTTNSLRQSDHKLVLHLLWSVCGVDVPYIVSREARSP